MQFLSISNLMMKNSVDSDGKVTHYSAHHYSVIPLGARSGLISWVDGVTPIFSIYRRWQQREAANPRKDQQFIAMRPSELYYSKITPLLKEHGLKPTDNRKDWPLAVQRKAFEELKAETPNSLLASEFWCMASTAAHWRQIVRNYSVSLAVMSVIGYCIGLGDRHLDNILVNLATGDVVHIDYNVCFEKGKTLRVPEKVPFRMVCCSLIVTSSPTLFACFISRTDAKHRRGPRTDRNRGKCEDTFVSLGCHAKQLLFSGRTIEKRKPQTTLELFSLLDTGWLNL